MGVVYTYERLAEAAADSISVLGVLRFLGVRPAGGAHAHVSRRLTQLGIDTSYFTGQGHRKGRPSPRRASAAEILVVLPGCAKRTAPNRLRRALAETGVPYECAQCGVGDTWQSRPLTLEVDHVNGDWLDNRRENLRLLCPNCHSQTATYCNYQRRERTPTG